MYDRYARETYVVEQLLCMINSAVELLFLLNVTKIDNLLMNFLHPYIENDVLPLYNLAQYDQSLDIENIVCVEVSLSYIHVPNGRDDDIYN
jgi:hypothetical protein